MACTGELEVGESSGDGARVEMGRTLGSMMCTGHPSRTVTFRMEDGCEMLSNSQSMAESPVELRDPGGQSEVTELDGGANFGRCG